MRLVSFRGQQGDTRTSAVVGERLIDLTQAIAALPLPKTIADCGLLAPIGGMMIDKYGQSPMALP